VSTILKEEEMKREVCYRMVRVVGIVMVVLFWAGVVYSQPSSSYSIKFDVISGGGGDGASPGYSNFGILGQPSPAGASTSPGYGNHAGFLYLLEPDVTVSLTAWNFHRVFVAQSSPPKSFTVRNPGTGDLAVGNIGLAGSPEFTLVTPEDYCSNQVLGPSEVCAFSVVFSPVSPGAKTATLSIPSNDEESPVSLALSGRGVRLMVDPEEGTLGTEVTVGGPGAVFGGKKGKVLFGLAKPKVVTWGSDSVDLLVSKALTSSAYDVVVTPKEPKGAASITEVGGFTVKLPEIGTVAPSSGPALTKVTISGKYFATKKGKVYLEQGGESKACKVVSWTMTPATGVSTIQFLVPKKYPVGTYTLRVTNKVGSCTGSFEVTP
jgi:hypothetical protein